MSEQSYAVETVVRGYHVYEAAWNVRMQETTHVLSATPPQMNGTRSQNFADKTFADVQKPRKSRKFSPSKQSRYTGIYYAGGAGAKILLRDFI